MGERRRRRRGARRRRKLLIAGAVLTAVAVAVLAWFAWSAQRVYADLDESRQQARALSDALSDGDAARAQRVLARFQEASDSAADRTDSFTWSVLEKVPLYGDDSSALETVSGVLSSLGHDAVAPLVETSHRLTANAYSPRQAQFPLEQIATLEGPATRSHQAFEDAVSRLAGLDSEGFVAPLRRAVDDLRAQVGDAEAALDTAARASRLMPRFLGGHGVREYLFVFQNNAEVRAGGGLPGNVSLVRAKDGRVEIVQQEAAGPMGQLRKPVLPLTDEELSVHGRQLGTYFLDSNFTPDFPRAAELWRARWRVEFGEQVDGVFTVDPVTLSYLLETTGPVNVEGYELTADNVVQVVENSVYLKFSDRGRQDEFLNAVAKTAFDAFANGAGDQVGMIRALARGVSEGRVRVHSFVDDEQVEIAGTEIGGELPQGERGATSVGVYLNDATAAKLSYYLRYDVQLAAVSCEQGRQRLTGRIAISSETPPHAEALPESVVGYAFQRYPGIEPGEQYVVGDLYGPVGGSIESVMVDGRPLDPPVVNALAGREVASVGLLFEPGASHEVTWEMSTDVGQTGDIEVAVTPGVTPENKSSTAPSAC